MFARLFSRKSKYDLDSIEGIQAIEIPKYKKLKGVGTPVNNIEYILQRKATEYMKMGESELALACLRKSNEIFPHSNFMWQPSNYYRLPNYLKKIRRFDEARAEEAKIFALFGGEDEPSGISMVEYQIAQARRLGVDLLITGTNDCLCAECAMFTRRVFSISGKDRRFPRLPEVMLKPLEGHEYCLNDEVYPYWYPDSTPTWNYRGNLIEWCNRPFKDERTTEQKAVFRNRVETSEQEALDRKNYDYIYEHLPNAAPKSFGGFRRMKRLNSVNYQRLVAYALEIGVNLNERPDTSMYKFK